MKGEIRNSCLVIIIFAFNIACVQNNSPCNDSETNCLFQKKDTLVEYYKNGKKKKISSYENNKKQGLHVEFNINGDTLKYFFYEKDSLIYYISFDNQQNKIDDKRKIFLSLNKDYYMLNDSVIVNYEIRGPQKNNFSIGGSCLKIAPDTSVNNGFFSRNQSGKYIIKPRSRGKYQVKIHCVDKKIRKIVGVDRIFFEVK